MSRDTGLNPRIHFETSFPNWEKPVKVGCFGINDERFYEFDRFNIKYLKLPQKLPIELNNGMEFAKKKPETDEALDHLLEHIINSYKKLKELINKRTSSCGSSIPMQQQMMPLYPAEFVAWRGLLYLVMCTPFEYSTDWIIQVIRYKGTHYFCERETQEAQKDRRNAAAYDNRICFWKYKFKQCCLTKSLETQPDTTSPVDECSEFACVFYTRLAGLNMLYGAEMDGIKSERVVNIKRELSSEKIEFVELKTQVIPKNDQQKHNFQSIKTRQWWCQAFLVGIENIFVGWRDELGLVKSIEELTVNQLTKQSKNWSPNTCAHFLIAFLNCVQTLMASTDCPYTVYEFRFDAKNSLITYEVFKGLTLKSFLPDYYINFMERISKQKA